MLVKSFVLDNSGPYAIAFSALHWHGEAEAWIDVTFGAFEGDAADDYRTTFGCRVGRVEGSDEPAATAVQAAVPYSNGPVFGHKLSRDEALAHARVADFWRVVDFLWSKSLRSLIMSTDIEPMAPTAAGSGGDAVGDGVTTLPFSV